MPTEKYIAFVPASICKLEPVLVILDIVPPAYAYGAISRDACGFAVPIPTHAFELMTTKFEPPPMLEKRATFEPIVPEPT